MDSLRILVFVGEATDKSLIQWVLQNSPSPVEVDQIPLKSELLATIVQKDYDCIITQGLHSGGRAKIVWDTLTSLKQRIPIILIKQKSEPVVLPNSDIDLSLLTEIVNIRDFNIEMLFQSVAKFRGIQQLLQENKDQKTNLEHLQHYLKLLSQHMDLGFFRLDKDAKLLHVSDEESFKILAPKYNAGTMEKIWEICLVDLGVELIWKRIEKGDENPVQKNIDVGDYEIELNFIPRMDGMSFEGLDIYYRANKKAADIELDNAIQSLRKDTIRQYEATVIGLEKKVAELYDRIEENKHRFSTLQGSIDRYQSILTEIPAFAFRLLEKKEGGLAISYIDSQLLELLDWKIEKLESLDFRLKDSFNPIELEKKLTILEDCRRQSTLFNSVITIKNKQGEWLDLKVSAKPVKQLTGNIFWSGIATLHNQVFDNDSTIPKTNSSNIEQVKTLMADREAALEQVRIKSQFLYNMSDEIRLPIEQILNMMEAILVSSESAQFEDYIDQALSAANNVISIINDIQDYAELENERLEINSISFNLRYLLRDVVNYFSSLCDEKSNNLFTISSSNIPQNIIADPGRIRQILTYLVNNSILDTSGGEISIKSQILHENNSMQILFQVRDSGEGIRPEDRPYLFYLFSSEHEGREHRRKSGLQLAVARQLVELMGGDFGIEAQHEGACFWFRIPVEFDRKNNRTFNFLNKNVANSQVILLSNKKDSQLARWMHSWNVTLDIIDEGDRVLEKMLERSIIGLHYQVVVLDSESQHEIDYDLIQIIKNDPELKSCKIILLAPSGVRGDSFKAQQMGVSAFLTKPVNYELFQNCLKAVLSQSHEDASLITRYSLSDWQPAKLGHALLADVNEENFYPLCRDLQLLGYTAEVASTEEDIINAVKENSYSVLLINLTIDFAQNLAICENIRDWEKANLNEDRIKIIGIVTSKQSSVQKDCLLSGVDTCIDTTELDSLKSVLGSGNIVAIH